MEFLTGINLAALIETVGYAGLFGIIFAESGLLFGFIFPGDSLLFTAGFLASQGFGNIITLAALGFIAAVLGDSAGYAFGKKFGPKIFRREDSWFFHRAHLERGYHLDAAPMNGSRRELEQRCRAERRRHT